MTPANDTEPTFESYLRAVLALSAKWEIYDDLWWSESGEFFIRCSDAFAYCTADCEPVTESDLPNLEQAIKDAAATGFEEYGPLLWVARKRGQRPITTAFPGPVVPALTEIAALFDACKKEQR